LGQSSGFAGLRIGVTGAGGSFGQALLRQLDQQGASLVALRHSAGSLDLRDAAGGQIPVQTVTWQVGEEEQLTALLAELQILVINHGINVMGARDREATRLSLEVNTLSALRLLELFLASPNPSGQRREIWVNTSEAEVNPAFSPLYEISKRTLGQLLSLRSLDAPWPVRRLVLGPFRSALNPYGFMDADRVAAAVVAQVLAGRELVIVSPNPLTWLLMPLAAWGRRLYFSWFTRHRDP